MKGKTEKVKGKLPALGDEEGRIEKTLALTSAIVQVGIGRQKKKEREEFTQGGKT